MEKEELINSFKSLSLSERLSIEEELIKINLEAKKDLINDLIWDDKITVVCFVGDTYKQYNGPDEISISIDGKSLQITCQEISMQE